MTASTWPFDSKMWMKIPLALRYRWWDETDYSKKQPSEELLSAVQAEIEKQVGDV